MRIIFAGTPAFAAHHLQALLNSPHQLVAVLTQPDRPAGRGRKLMASPVKQLAASQDLAIYQPQRLDDTIQSLLKSLDADVMVVVAYGLIIPAAVLSIPRYGCINVHASLLPRWRGAAPIQRAIQAGDQETGITTMQMDAGLDTGDMLLQQSCAITAEDTSQTLHDKLAELGINVLLQTLANYSSIQAIKQDNKQSCYAHKITKTEAIIDWQQAVEMIDRQIRAFNPWPVATSQLNQTTIRIWSAEIISIHKDNHDLAAGTIINCDEKGIDVITGAGLLRLKTLQFPGGKALPVKDLLNARQGFFSNGKKFT
ncbi:MAG: methionyl-tRNA formyltransferase [Pseudomonadota bacterium]